jgi:hypothetical protein
MAHLFQPNVAIAYCNIVLGDHRIQILITEGQTKANVIRELPRNVTKTAPNANWTTQIIH